MNTPHDGEPDSGYTNQDPDLKFVSPSEAELVIPPTAEENLIVMHNAGARAFGMLEALMNFGYIPEHLRAQAQEIFDLYYKAAPKVIE